jgi:hypothetical protein
LPDKLHDSSYRCDCGYECGFAERTIRELGKVSQRRTQYLIDDGHRIEFTKGKAVAVHCPTKEKPMDRIYVMQLVRSFQVGEISRRTFLRRATAAVGGLSAASLLLAACQPVTGTPRPVTEAVPSGEGVGSAESNMTTAAGLVTGAVEYPGLAGRRSPVTGRARKATAPGPP